MNSQRVFALLLLVLLLAGCLVPLPLTEQTVADGGQILMVTSAMPVFGTTPATSTAQFFSYQVEVLTDSPQIAGRLFIEVNDACCSFVDDPNVTQFKQNGTVTQENPSAGNLVRYTIEFPNQFQPCTMVPPHLRANVIPVLATEGFPDGPTGVVPNGLGIVDSSHFWQVSCP
jgi:hypothetical protein